MRFASKLVLIIMMLVVALTSLGGIATASNAGQVSQFITPIMIVNSSFLNVRTGPGVQYEVLITVVGGTDMPVLGVANDRVWYQVSTVVGIGWVNSEFVIPRGDFTNTPVVDTTNLIANAPLVAVGGVIGLPYGQGGGAVFPTATITTTGATSLVGATMVAGTDANGNPIIVSGPGERFRAILNVPAVDLRTAPGDNQPSLGTLFQDVIADYPIVGDGRDSTSVPWFSIITPRFGTGWVDSPKITLRLSAVAGTVMVVTADSIQLGDGPGTGSTRLPIITHGTEGWLRNISQDSNFIQIELAGGELGWIPWDAAQPRTGTPTDGLDLSALAFAPGVAPGTAGVITTTTLVRPTITLSTARVIVNTAFLNVRSGPGAQYTSVATVSGGTELLVLGIAKDRVWYLVEGRFGRGWLNSEFTIFRGVIDNVPIINPDALIGAIVQQATAIISAPTTLYAAPGTNFGSIGVLSPPSEVVIVARTIDNTWVQLNTPLGFGWALSSQVLIQGDLSSTPIVG